LMQTTNDDQPTPLFRISSSSQIIILIPLAFLIENYAMVLLALPAKKRSF